MKGRIVVIGFLILLALSFSCEAMFSKTIPIRVVDYNYRPIQGAQVSIYYQRSGALLINGSQRDYVWSPPVPTDTEGLARVWIHNQEENPDLVDCRIKVRVRYGGYETIVEKDRFGDWLTVDNLPKELLVKLPVSRLKIRVMSDKKVYLPFKYIAGEIRGEGMGVKEVPLPEGDYSVYIIHKGVKKKFNVRMKKEEDYNLDVVYRYVRINLSVFDEQGKPIAYKLYLDTGDVIEGKGKREIKIIAGVHNANLEVEGRNRSITINPAVQLDYRVYLDHTPPEISNVRVDFFNNKTIITLTARDKGKFASGVSRVYITFYFLDGTIISKEFSKGVFDDYRTEVAKVGNFNFVIKAYDKEGNSVEIKGKQEITTVPKVVKKKADVSGIVVILGVLILLVAGGWYIKKKLEESEAEI